MTLSAREVHRLKLAPAVEGVLPVFHERWSPRSFAEREVSPAELRKIFEAARWAASSYNEQPWRFLVGTRGSETYQKIYGSLGGFNREWAVTAPVLILGTASTRFRHNGETNTFAVYDLGAAAAYMVLQAAAQGLTAHQMAGYDQGVARQELEIPEVYALGSVIALGYQGEPTALTNGRLVEMEMAPRQRKPLSEIVFSAWGKAAELG